MNASGKIMFEKENRENMKINEIFT